MRGFHFPEQRPTIVRCFERGEGIPEISRKISRVRSDIVRRGIEEQIRLALVERGRRVL